MHTRTGIYMENNLLFILKGNDNSCGKLVTRNTSDRLREARSEVVKTEICEELISGSKIFKTAMGNEIMVRNGSFDVYLEPRVNDKIKSLLVDEVIIDDNKGNRFAIRVDMYNLLSTLKKSNIIGEKIQDRCYLATCRNSVYLLNGKTDDYARVRQEMDMRKLMSKNKTTKYKLGYEYSTYETKAVYAGDIYRWLDFEYSVKRDRNTATNEIVSAEYTLKFRENPVKMYWMIDGYYGKYKESLKDYIEEFKDKYIDNISNKNREIFTYTGIFGVSLFNYDESIKINKVPKRCTGKKIDIKDAQDTIENFYKWWMDILKSDKYISSNKDNINIHLDKIGYSGSSEINPVKELTENDFDLIKLRLCYNSRLKVIDENGNTIYNK